MKILANIMTLIDKNHINKLDTAGRLNVLRNRPDAAQHLVDLSEKELLPLIIGQPEIIKHLKITLTDDLIFAALKENYLVAKYVKVGDDVLMHLFDYFVQLPQQQNRYGQQSTIKTLIEENKRKLNTIIKLMGDLSPAVQMFLIKKNTGNISLIPNPTEKVQIISVTHDYENIRGIKNPIRAVVDEFVNIMIERHRYQSGLELITSIEKYIEVTDDVLCAIVKTNGAYIQKINLPTDEMKKLAVTQSAENIRYIINPSPELQLIAIASDERSIGCISNPCEEAQLLSVQDDVDNVLKIMSPTTPVIEYVMNKLTEDDNVSTIVSYCLANADDAGVVYIRMKHAEKIKQWTPRDTSQIYSLVGIEPLIEITRETIKPTWTTDDDD